MVRRVIALLIMLLMPLQFAWSASHYISGHVNNETAAAGSHNHDAHHVDGDQHHEAGFVLEDRSPDRGHASGHGEDGDSGSHFHPVFTLLVIEPDLRLEASSSAGPPIHPPASFTPHIPPLFDWPPAARV